MPTHAKGHAISFIYAATASIALVRADCEQRSAAQGTGEPLREADGGPGLSRLYRICDADSKTHMEYDRLTVPKGKEAV